MFVVSFRLSSYPCWLNAHERDYDDETDGRFRASLIGNSDLYDGFAGFHLQQLGPHDGDDPTLLDEIEEFLPRIVVERGGG